jgi:sterol desaturase/sphingolipid hydroxylase (fatty acid hydroxylase superfamily)
MTAGSDIVARLSVFVAVFAAMALLEMARPCRRLVAGRLPRWPHNLALVVIDSLVVRLTVPLAAFGAAELAQAHAFGLFHLIGFDGAAGSVIGFLALDLAIYLQHVIFHHVPLLWRLHRVHHADPDIDVTTGLRFHPLEILLSLAIKIAVVVLLGIPPLAVLVFEIVLNATAMFNHANVALPAPLDRLLRLVVVTPDMHRVHHSIERAETDSNFGFNLPWWDYLFRTYRAAPRAGHQGMTIGLPVFRNATELRIDRLLTQPFRDDQTARAPIARPDASG